MALITIPNTFSAGAVIVASQHNANFSTIATDYNGNIDNTNIATSAAIAYSKLNLAGSIVNADINSSAGIVASKLDLTSPGAIGSTAPNTGAFTTLKVGTTNQGDILYDNGTSITRLTPGTSGQVLITQGAGANPTWGSPGGISLISATTVTSATTSGNIAIAKGSYYFVNFSLINGSGSTAQFGLRFNADSGTHYHYNYEGRDTSAARSAGATGQTSVFLSPTIPTGNLLSGQLNLSQSQENLQDMLVNGQTNGLFAAASARGFVNVMGWWGNSADVTSFSIVADFAYSGVIYLYKYSLT